MNEYQHIIDELLEEAEEIKRENLAGLAAGRGIDAERLVTAALFRCAAGCLQESGDRLSATHGD